MSLRNYDPRSWRRKRPLTGTSDNGEGSGGRDTGGLKTGRSIAPALGALSQGQELGVT